MNDRPDEVNPFLVVDQASDSLFEDDQLIPDTIISLSMRRVQSSSVMSTIESRERLQNTQREATTVISNKIDENENANGTMTSIEKEKYYNIQQYANYTTLKKGNTPKRPSGTRDLAKLVKSIYEDGSRSPQLMSLVQNSTGPLPMRLAIVVAEYTFRLWENSNAEAAPMGLINFVATLLHKTAPSLITVMLASFYVGQLRKLFPEANGESGCSHRLISVALLIAYRYYQMTFRTNITEEFYQQWFEAVCGVFRPEDLLRMEMEFIAFLKFKLYVNYDDFEYFVDRVFNSIGGQHVPKSMGILDLMGASTSTTTNSKLNFNFQTFEMLDASVADLDSGFF